MGFKSCYQGDDDVYMNKDNNTNGDLYCRYLLVYVDYVIFIGENSDGTTNILEQFPG